MRKAKRVVLAATMIAWAATCVSAATNLGKVVFTSDRTGSWQVYTMNTDGSDQFQVTNLAPTDDDGIFPSLSPDGKRVAFTYNAGDGPDLFIVNADGSGQHAITDDHGSFWPRWSPEGQQIVFSTFAGLRDVVIATMPVDGSGPRKILTSDIWESVGGFYTPDGKQIIFGSSIGGYVSAAWIMDADGSHQRRLTPAALKAQPWGVSPDGKHIVGYTNQNTPAALPENIFVMKLNGSGLKLVAESPTLHHNVYPSYSPDGSTISFSSDRFASDIAEFTFGTFDILNVDSDGANVRVAAPTVASCPFDGNCVTPLAGPGPVE